MTCALRIFIIGPDDPLYRVAGTKFPGMFDDQENYCFPAFAGQRVRMVEAIVELRDRIPCGIVRLVYEMIKFDDSGRLDRNALYRQNAAFADLIPNKPKTDETVVVNASSRFIAQGARWRPSPSLMRQIHKAAFGEVKCKRL